VITLKRNMELDRKTRGSHMQKKCMVCPQSLLVTENLKKEDGLVLRSVYHTSKRHFYTLKCWIDNYYQKRIFQKNKMMMSISKEMVILVSKDGQNSEKFEKTEFENEDKVQQLIHENIENLPFYGQNEELRLLSISREFSTKHGPIDVLAIDENGDIYVIEAKLHKNSTRREIVAQVIDYASAMWADYKNFDRFENQLNQRTGQNLRDFIKNSDVFSGLGEDDLDTLVDKIKRNLAVGNFKFVLVMDELDEQLTNVIDFINSECSFSIYAVTFDYYNPEGLEIIIPNVYGREAEKSSRIKSSSSRKKWDENSFFEDLRKKIPNYIEQARKLYDFSKETPNCRIKFGSGATQGSINPVFQKISPMKSLFTLRSNGNFSFNFHWIDENDKQKEYRDKFIEKLSQIPELDVSANDKTKFKSVPLEIWTKHTDEIIRIRM